MEGSQQCLSPMKSVTEPSLSPHSHDLLDNFAKHNPPSFRPPPSRLTDNHKHRSPNDCLSDHHRPLVCQTSRKNLQAHRNELQERYEQIERILVCENDNLKKQNGYLSGEVRRLLKRQRHLRRELQELRERERERQEQLVGAMGRLERELHVIRQYFSRQIARVVVALQTDSLAQLKSVLGQFVGEVTAFLGMASDEPAQDQPEPLPRHTLRQAVAGGAGGANRSAEQEVEQLTQRLQSIIAENGNSCRQPGVRRECIQIARQIKQIQASGRPSHRRRPSDLEEEVLSSYLPEERQTSTGRRGQGKRSEEEDNYRYPKQIYTKVTYRRGSTRENKMVRADSSTPKAARQPRD